VEEEADESICWLEVSIGSELAPEGRVAEIIKEANEITAMTVASVKTLRMRQQ
jgi:hypothetical protein